MRVSIPIVFTILSTDTPMNSNGNKFTTVQAAIDDLNGDGWVFVPAGTYNESVTIDENNVTLFGVGISSYINGGTTGHGIHCSGNYCVIKDLKVATTGGGGNSYDAIKLEGHDCVVERVFISDSDNIGINIDTGGVNTISNCRIGIVGASVDAIGIYLNHGMCVAIGNHITDTGTHGIAVGASGDKARIVGNYIRNAGDDGILLATGASNCLVDSNIIDNSTNEDIDDDSGGTSTIGDNETI